MLVKNGFVLHNMQNCYVQNIFSLLIFLYNNHEILYKDTSIAEVDEKLMEEIKKAKNNLDRPNSMEFIGESTIVDFDPNKGYSFKNDYYPLKKYELLKEKLGIETVLDSDSVEDRNKKIANNSRYYMYKIIKLLRDLKYNNFIKFSYKFSVIIYKLYILNWVNFVDSSVLNEKCINRCINIKSINDSTNQTSINKDTNNEKSTDKGVDKKLIDDAIESLKQYCNFFKPSRTIIYQLMSGKFKENYEKLEKNEITIKEFADIYNIDITSKYYHQNVKGFSSYGSAVNKVSLLASLKPFSISQLEDVKYKIEQASKLRQIYISLVKHIFNLPFKIYNDNDEKEINDLEEIKGLPNGIYINVEISNHYHNFIKHNGIYIMFDDVIHNPTITYKDEIKINNEPTSKQNEINSIEPKFDEFQNESDDKEIGHKENPDKKINIKYKNIKVKKVDGNLCVESVISNHKISTPVVLENLIEDDKFRFFGKPMIVDNKNKQGMLTYNYDTTSISKKMTGSSKQSMVCNIILIIITIISVIILIVIVIEMTKIQKALRCRSKSDI